jgi:GSCFA family
VKAYLDISGLPMEFPEDVNPQGEAPKVTYPGFYRGEVCNFYPSGADQRRPDFCEHFLLKGTVPEHPVIRRDSRITAFGSCFAHNITAHLEKLGFDLSKQREPSIYISTIGEGLVNVYAILSQFQWALEGVAPATNLWHGHNAQLFSADETIREKTRQVFLNTDVFIITIGVSELWYDEVTGGIFWRAVPRESFDPTRHKFRVCTVAETTATLTSIRELIRRHTDAEIIFTLSPIPLIATFRDQSCIVANTASKAILRAGFDEFFRSSAAESDDKCHYFPAYEAVTTLFPSVLDDDGHHPHQFVIEAVMQIFEANYCETELTKAEAENRVRGARARSAEFSGRSATLSALDGGWLDPNLERANRDLAHMKTAYEAVSIAVTTLQTQLAQSQQQAALDVSHMNAAYVGTRVELLVARGDTSGALGLLNELIADGANNSALLSQRSALRFSVGRSTEAIADARAALACAPDAAHLMHALSHLLATTDERAEALAVIEQAISREPANAGFLAHRAGLIQG